MLAAVRAGRSADTDARDNLRTFALCEAAYESAAAGRLRGRARARGLPATAGRRRGRQPPSASVSL